MYFSVPNPSLTFDGLPYGYKFKLYIVITQNILVMEFHTANPLFLPASRYDD